MAKVDYPKYKILIDPDSKKVQGLKVGDVVRHEYYDAPNHIYSLMVVLETGAELVGGADSAYFIGALVEGDEPVAGQMLDFVRVTNLFDEQRSGALYLTASDADSPYMDVIDGAAKEFSLCWPVMDSGDPAIPDGGKYALMSEYYLDAMYREMDVEVRRVFRLSRRLYTGPDSYGIKITLDKSVARSQKLLVSFRVRTDVPMENIPVKFGYADDSQFDFADTISASDKWE